MLWALALLGASSEFALRGQAQPPPLQLGGSSGVSRRLKSAFSKVGQLPCAAGEYFDISALQCSSCDGVIPTSNRIPDPAVLAPDGVTPLDCKCKPGYRRVDNCAVQNNPYKCPASLSFACVACGGSAAASRDGSRCMACGSGSTFDAVKKECVCATAGHVLIEANVVGEPAAAKTCVPCATGQRALATGSPYACASCGRGANLTMAADGACTCTAGYQQTGKAELGGLSCIAQGDWDKVGSLYRGSAAATVKFRDVQSAAGSSATTEQSLVSLHTENTLFASVVSCWHYVGPGDLAACQAVANMCALAHYHKDAAPCRAFEQFRVDNTRPEEHSVTNWRATLPWLRYEDNFKPFAGSSNVEMSVTFDPTQASVAAKQAARLTFKLAAYAFNGTFLGFEDLADQLSFCRPHASDTRLPGPSRSTKWLNFGYGYSEAYECDLGTLLAAETKLYDLYLVDEVSAAGSWYPVPVHNLNYLKSNVLVNQNSRKDQELDDVYTRRFFLFDAISGVKTKGEPPEFIRYAKSIKVRTTTLPSSPNKIYPPMVEIEYAERPTVGFVPAGSAAATGAEAALPPALQHASLKFVVEYTADTSKFWEAATVLFVVSMIFVFGVWLLRINNWNRRNTRDHSEGTVDFNFSARAAVYFASTFATVFFWLTFVLACYWYALFKLQSDVFLLLPPSTSPYGVKDDYYPFEVMLYMCFFFQALRIMEILVVQCSSEIFFMDWERPRGQFLDQDKGRHKPTPVSAWRTILACNEFNELMTTRKTSVEFTLVWLAFLLKGLGLENYATPQPNGADLAAGEHNLFLRFANTTFWWLVLSKGQELWNFLVWERYFTEPKPLQFIDLCTVAKVSLLILDERYHGVYLHCTGSSAHADGDMDEIAEGLRQEAEGITTGGRGLDTHNEELKDVQAFEIFLTQKWRMRYDSHLKRARQQLTGGAGGGRGGGGGRGNAFASADPKQQKEMVKCSKKLNKFLQDFVGNGSEYKYRLEAPVPKCFSVDTDRLMQVPPDLSRGADGMSIMQHGACAPAFLSTLPPLHRCAALRLPFTPNSMHCGLTSPRRPPATTPALCPRRHQGHLDEAGVLRHGARSASVQHDHLRHVRLLAPRNDVISPHHVSRGEARRRHSPAVGREQPCHQDHDRLSLPHVNIADCARTRPPRGVAPTAHSHGAQRMTTQRCLRKQETGDGRRM